MQPIWRLQANDQDWAAGSEAKNSLRTNSEELAGLVAKETATERATKQEKVSDIHQESKGWAGDSKLTGVQDSQLEMVCLLAASDYCSSGVNIPLSLSTSSPWQPPGLG